MDELIDTFTVSPTSKDFDSATYQTREQAFEDAFLVLDEDNGCVKIWHKKMTKQEYEDMLDD